MNSLSLFKRPFAEGITTALLIMDKGIAYNTEVLFGISRIFIKKLFSKIMFSIKITKAARNPEKISPIFSFYFLVFR